MSVKFLHTADWQMGMKALQAGHRASDVRAKRFQTARGVAELAKRENVDFVVIAGDLFEDHDVDEAVVRKTVAVLESFAPIPVYVLPGNHDPLTPGSIWDRQSWQRVGDHVHLLVDAEEIQVRDDVVLYPAPLTQKRSAIDPTAWIPPRDPNDKRIRIGIAHGALDVLPQRANFPIAASRAHEAGLDYLALGDWHGFAQYGKAVYSGTFEQTCFNEKNAGNVVIVQISSAGQQPLVCPHRVGELHWLELEASIRDSSDVGRLRRCVLEGGPLSVQLLRITPLLEPGVSPIIIEELKNLRAELEQEAFLLDWPIETLEIPPARSMSLPPGLLTDVATDLNSIIEGRIPEGPAREMAGMSPDVVREALTLLYRIVSEAQS
jgi:DNA repair exonuclease SbcCD nuclease subunit